MMRSETDAVDLRPDLDEKSAGTSLGRPDAVLVSAGGRTMWAYQRLGLYLYFSRGRLVAWRRYPTGCDQIAHPEPSGPRPRQSGSIAAAI